MQRRLFIRSAVAGSAILHHHMLGEQPRTVFLHYYGRGPTVELAHGFRAAMDQLGKRNPGGMKH